MNNAIIEKDMLPEIKHHFNQEHINENREALIDLCVRYNARINTFFKHKLQHKITRQNSTMDYNVVDKTLRGAVHNTHEITCIPQLGFHSFLSRASSSFNCLVFIALTVPVNLGLPLLFLSVGW